jgi:hypothetical protein
MGLLGVWGVVGVYVLEVQGPLRLAGGKQLLFLGDGTPRVIQTVVHGDWRYLDLEGNEVPPPEDGPAAWLPEAELPAQLPDRAASGDVSWGKRVRSFSDGRAPAVLWYLMTDGRPGGLAYFVGYDSRNKTRVGYLGTAGYRKDMPPGEEQFPFSGATVGPDKWVFSTQNAGSTEHPRGADTGRAPRGCLSPWDVYLLGHDDQLYHIDLQQGIAHVALSGPRLRSAALVSAERDGKRGTSRRLAVRTADAVLVLDERGGVRQGYAIPEELRKEELHFAQTSSGEAVMYSCSPLDLGGADDMDCRIWWVAADGATRHASVTLTDAFGDMKALRWISGVVVPCPLAANGLLSIGWTRHLQNEGLAATYPEALAKAVRDFWPGLVLVHLLSAGLAVLCYRRQVRYGASRAEQIAWPLFVLALGLPGWVGYRFGRSWPALEACPACGAAAPRDRAECAGCAAAFLPPALKGTEVFA